MAYNRDFYLDLADVSARSASVIVPVLRDAIEPTSVIDVGCGAGTWMAAWLDAGVTDVWGVDGSRAPDESLGVPRDLIRRLDLGSDLRLDRTYDLVTSFEVAEHLPESRAASFVHDLTRLGPVVAFSAAIPLQGGTGHVTERWQSWWAAHFETEGFAPSVALRTAMWNEESAAAYYAQNLVVYVREDLVSDLPVLFPGGHRAPAEVLDVVHPRLWQRRVGHPFVGWVGSRLPEGAKNALTQRLRPRVKFLQRL